jgi:hypothetical protein
MKKPSETVVVYDCHGLNCVYKSPNALAVVRALLASVKLNYTVQDVRYTSFPKDKIPHRADYIVEVENW